MRIGIDARFYGPHGKGLGRYTQKLIEHLEAIDTHNKYVIFLRRENFDNYKPVSGNFSKVLVDIPWYSWKEQLVYPWKLYKYKLDLMHFPHFNVPILYNGKFIVTIHDLILFHFPTVRASTLPRAYYWFKYFVYKKLIRYVTQKAHMILTVSQFTKDDIQKNLHISNDKIYVTYEANSNLLTNNKQKVLWSEIARRYGILKPYILYVGNAYPHKNLEKLVDIFHNARMGDVQLILVGNQDFFYKRLQNKVTDRKIQNIVFAYGVSDEELDKIYRHARVFLFLSLYEGFGLPPLEAMARNIPVLASNRSSLPEILNGAAFLANPEDKKKSSEALRRVFSDDELRNELIRKGRERIKDFSWRDLAQKTHKEYLSVLTHKNEK